MNKKITISLFFTWVGSIIFVFTQMINLNQIGNYQEVELNYLAETNFTERETVFKNKPIYKNSKINAVNKKVEEDDSCALLDFTNSELELISGQGSVIGTFNVDKTGVTIDGNGWNAIEIPQNIDADDILMFEFLSTEEGEEHAIGFANTIAVGDLVNGTRFKLYGTQNVPVTNAFQDFTYTEIGEWQSFQIPLGAFFTGDFTHIVFVNDNDGNPVNGNSSFKNIKIISPEDECYIDIFTGTSGVPSIDYAFNFGTSDTLMPDSFIGDTGEAYSAKNNLEYGWILASDNSSIDASEFTRNRLPNPDADALRESFMHMNRAGISPNIKWEIAVPDGTYRIVLQSGDPNEETTPGTHHLIKAEGVTVIDFTPGTGFGTRTGVVEVAVTDGKLTLDGSDGFNAKLNSVVIQTADGIRYPSVLNAIPADGDTDVSLDSSISANFLSLPNINFAGLSSLDNTTITADTVKLYEVNGNISTELDITVNGTGGGDAINISISNGLEAETRYRYSINGVQDLSGGIIFPYSAEFITGAVEVVDSTGGIDDVIFVNEGAVSEGSYSSLLFGPDNKLYGLQLGGDIDRWTVDADGLLNEKETLTGLTDAYGGSRLAIGIAFAPNSTATDPIVYISHSTFVFNDGESYDGNISRLTGSNLENEELVVTNLPRSVRDHLTNSIVFNPNDSDVLYFSQGSNSAGGEADAPWGNRAENILSGAVLRLDLGLLPDVLPLDVKTTDDVAVINSLSTNLSTTSDGFYNPYYENAALTIFGSGVRNAYDLIWHSNGQLYVPTNGTAGGSNSPASVTGTRRPNGDFYNGQEVPMVSGNIAQRDYLFRLDPDLPIGYYGHPNPLRGEYVLNNGALSTDTYESEIIADENYRGFAFDFEFNKSPNGVIEYKSPGALQGSLIVCRYSGGSDLIVLFPDGTDGDIETSKIGVTGFSDLSDPLDLVEDPNTGNIYVSDLGLGQIILLKLDDSGETESPENSSIKIDFTTPQNDTVFEDGKEINIEVLATSDTGTISKVELFVNDEAIRTDNFAPYSWSTTNIDDTGLSDLPLGNYELKALATDDEGNINETIINISIVEEVDDNPINISFATPADGDIFGNNDLLNIEALATSSVGDILKVDLFINDIELRTEEFSPYSWDSTNEKDIGLVDLAVGKYELRTIATDSEGNINESVINITIIEQEDIKPEIYVENMRKIPGTEIAFPYNDRIVFHRAATSESHQQFSEYSTIRIHNRGTGVLNMSSIVVSNEDFELLDYDESNVVIERDSFNDYVIRFVTETGNKGIREGTLSVFSDDINSPEVVINLAGGFMEGVEGSNELIPQEVMDILGFPISLTGGDPFNSAYPTSDSVESGEQGDLVVSQYWETADITKEVNVFYINAFKSIGSANVKFVDENGDTVNNVDMRFTEPWHQTFFPRSDNEIDGNLASEINFVDEPFAISIANRTTLGSGFDETTGLPENLAIRVYKVVNNDGTIRADEYIAIMDYSGERGCVYTGTGNCDYNDVALYITNIKPVSTSIDEEIIVYNAESSTGLVSKTSTSLFNEDTTLGISVFPNPTSHTLFIDVSELINNDLFQVTIYNFLGQVVFNRDYDYDGENNILDLDLSVFQPGKYTLLVKSNNSEPHIRKILIK